MIQLPIILLLILANGVFAMSEMAVVSARKVRLRQRAKGGDKRAWAALELAKTPGRFLSTVQVGISLVAALTEASSIRTYLAGVGLSAGGGSTGFVAGLTDRSPGAAIRSYGLFAFDPKARWWDRPYLFLLTQDTVGLNKLHK